MDKSLLYYFTTDRQSATRSHFSINLHSNISIASSVLQMMVNVRIIFQPTGCESMLNVALAEAIAGIVPHILCNTSFVCHQGNDNICKAKPSSNGI